MLQPTVAARARRTAATIRWPSGLWLRVCDLATDIGVSRNDATILLVREALDERQRRAGGGET